MGQQARKRGITTSRFYGVSARPQLGLRPVSGPAGLRTLFRQREGARRLRPPVRRLVAHGFKGHDAPACGDGRGVCWPSRVDGREASRADMGAARTVLAYDMRHVP